MLGYFFGAFTKSSSAALQVGYCPIRQIMVSLHLSAVDIRFMDSPTPATGFSYSRERLTIPDVMVQAVSGLSSVSAPRFAHLICVPLGSFLYCGSNVLGEFAANHRRNMYI
jgi:hypothetical protein